MACLRLALGIIGQRPCKLQPIIACFGNGCLNEGLCGRGYSRKFSVRGCVLHVSRKRPATTTYEGIYMADSRSPDTLWAQSSRATYDATHGCTATIVP
jgi:hypothetical protein